MTIVAIVPARGGSQGLPGKNSLELGGKSLIQRSIEFAQLLELDDIIFSSDKPEYIRIAESFGATTLGPRSREASTSESMEEHVIDDLNEKMAQQNYPVPGAVVWLRPTFVFRSMATTKACVDDVMRGNFSASRVVTEVDPRLYRAGGSGTLETTFNDGGASMVRRQGLDPLYRVFNTDVFLWPSGPCPRDFLCSNISFHVAPLLCGFDIDTIEDFNLVRLLATIIPSTNLP